jgi:hemerythrin-like domain-containing protein
MHSKEQNVLYPMIDQVLAEDRNNVLEAVRKLQQSQG